ncbi:chemotaxis protein CheX [Aquabacterium fontiphilum]|uniref:chemotaxis protein CheX n=1 Tax=Aquabacterium fontiphilum TaxID=450365 RepID=UPI001377E1A3|nr:chemotaxis protein CheX [Aquabacterium fontiphilum]NBD19764.1 chemotaxis protein CheX [Aquabacterium fontiphilum]
MVEAAQLVSKVLVLDDDPAATQRIKAFCDDNNLVGVKTQSASVMSVLRSNVDLGAIFLSETYRNDGEDALAFAREIHTIRPELPVFLRREAFSRLDDLSERDQTLFSKAYTLNDIEALVPVLSETIFSLVYPNGLVRGITEITKAALESQFKGVEVHTEAPYIVRDRIIFGELFTLIPLESNWCRGYMMLQTEEKPLIGFVERDKTHIVTDAVNFRDINHVLGEVTNLVWGSFKNRYIAFEPLEGRQSQVPIIVNHLHRYISFGSEDPQLCFKYMLTDTDGGGPSLVIYQRFVFNLSWAPEKFKENEAVAEDLFDSGELELF